MSLSTTSMKRPGRRPEVTTWVTPAIEQEFTAAGWWNDETWIELARARAVEDPEAVAVVDEVGLLTRGEAMSHARRLAAYLWHKGVRPGDVVTLVLPNWREFVVVHTAVGLLGAVVSPLLPKSGRTEMAHIISTSGSRFVFAAAEHRGSRPYEAACAAAEGLDHVLGVLAVRGGDASYEAVLDEPWEARIEIPEIRVLGSDWDTVTFTSGTESLPKGVVHAHRSTMFGLRSYIGGILQLGSADIVFMPSPICHASGIEWGLRTSIYVGSPLILQDRWDPAVALELIDRYACTYMLAATPFIIDLLAAKADGKGSGTSLRFVASGGAAIPRDLVVAAREAFDAKLMAVFGSSETYVATATRPGDPERMLATDGAPLPGTRLEIVDEIGVTVPTGEEGEILTRGPHVFLGYLGDPDLTARAFLDTWFRSGDLGHLDEDGMLHVTGRIKDIVIRGGENISVREVEELLLEHPFVSGVAIVAYPHERLGEICCAVVVPVRSATIELADVTSYLLERGLAKYKLPEKLVVVDELPMTATGKVRKAELRRLLVEDIR